MSQAPVFGRLLVESTEEDTGGDILPGDVLDGDQIDTGFYEKHFDVGSLDVIDQVFLEGIHKILESALFFIAFGGPIKDDSELFNIEVLFRFIRLGDFERFFLEFAHETLMTFLTLFLPFLAIEDIGFRQIETIGFDEFPLDDILDILDGRYAVHEDFRVDAFNVLDHLIGQVRNECFVRNGDGVAGEFDGSLDAFPVERDDFSVSAADFFYGHSFDARQGAVKSYLAGAKHGMIEKVTAVLGLPGPESLI